MSLDSSLIILGCIINLIVVSLAIMFMDYDTDFNEHILYSLDKTDLSEELKKEVANVYVKNNKSFKSYIALIFLGISISLSVFIAIKFVLIFTVGLIFDILLTVLLTTIQLVFVCLFVIDMFDGFRWHTFSFKITSEDIIRFYFEKKYLSISGILFPVYKHVKIDKYLYELISEHKTKWETKYTGQYFSRFGNLLNTFILLFEKSIEEDCSEKVFIYEVLKPENVSLLAKLVVMLNEPDLLKQLVNENENETAIEFNDSLEEMLTAINTSVDNIIKIESDLVLNQDILDKQRSEEESRDRLDRIVKQNFNSLEK